MSDRLAFFFSGKKQMKNKTNEELYHIIISDEYAHDALAQLISNLTPMMVSIGRKHLGRIPLYDTEDYIQEGSLALWKIIQKKIYNDNGKFSSLFYTVFDRHCKHLFRDYVLKNLMQIHETEDMYLYGYQISTLVIDDYAVEYREKHRKQCRRYAEKHKVTKSEPPMKPKLTDEERRERNRLRRQEYYNTHKEQYREAKKKWYQEHREYALRYQKAYKNVVRIGKKGPCKK